MDNWAPYLLGYQKHEQQSETDSIWTLKGDVGVLARIVNISVHIDEWNGPDLVRFTLKGIDEAIEGSGRFTIGEAPDASEEPTELALPTRKSWVQRVVDWLFRLLNPRAEANLEKSGDYSGPETELVFYLNITPLGPTAPIVSVVLTPWMEQCAQELAHKIAAKLEGSPS
jgi:hypothetical protein